MKYTIVKVFGIIIHISKGSDINESVIEATLPTYKEFSNMSDYQLHNWTNENNARMVAICDFLNKSNL